MGVNQVKFGNATVMDISDSTVAPETLLSGVSAYNKAGNKITGEVVVEHVEVEPVLETGTKSASITVGEESADIYCENTKAEVKNMKTTQSATIANKIAQFECIDKNFVKLLKLAMEPIQDLHGYDHPWVGGAGKNKLNLADNYAIDSEAGVNISPSIASNIPVKGGVTYTLSCYQRDAYTSKDPTKTRYTLSVRGLDGKNIYEDEASNPQLTPHQHYITFTPEVDQTVGFIIWIQYTSDDCRFEHFMLEVSSTPTEWAPYSNICPISGRTEASVVRTGKNLLNVTAESTSIYTVNTDGTIKGNGNSNGVNFTIGEVPCNTSTTFILNGCPSGGGDSAYRLDIRKKSNPNVGYAYDTGNGVTFTIDEPFYVAIRSPNGASVNNILFKPMVRFSSVTDATFEPYTAETHTHQYGQTVYGGVDDFVNGGATVTKGYVDLSTLTWELVSLNRWQSEQIVDIANPSGTSVATDAICDMYTAVPITTLNADETLLAFSVFGNRIYLRNGDTTNSPTGNICYTLSTPATIQTSAEKITTLPGVNVISATEPISECNYRVLEENLSDTIYSNETLVGEDSDVYTLRTAPDISDANYVEEKIVGGSVVWNQLVQNGNFASTSGWASNVSGNTISASNNELFVVANTLGLTVGVYCGNTNHPTAWINGHVYLTSAEFYSPHNTTAYIGKNNETSGSITANSWSRVIGIKNNLNGGYPCVCYVKAHSTTGFSSGDVIKFRNYMVFDLTLMLGSAVADYIYNLENTTAGTGVAFLKKYGFLTRDYYDYNTGSLQSVNFNKWFKTSKNLFNLHRLQGVVNIIDGNDVYVRLQKNSQQFFHDYKSYIPGNRTYTLQFDPPSDFSLTYAALRCRLKDNSDFGNVGAIDGWTYQSLLKNYRQSFENASHVEITATIPDCLYCEFGIGTNNSFENIKETGTYVKFSNIQLEVGSEATVYEPYEGYEISLDDNLDLRGLFKIVDNKLVADGDIYEGDGKITRKYGVVDMSSLTWTKFTDTSYGTLYYTDNLIGIAGHDFLNEDHLLCSIYNSIINTGHDGKAGTASEQPDGSIRINVISRIYIRDESCATLEDFQSKISNAKLFYELLTPLLNRGTNFDSPHVFIPNGNEYFVKTYASTPDRDFDIPAGHVGKYYGKSMFKEISLPTIPKSGGTYILKCNVLADGNKKLYWCADGD